MVWAAHTFMRRIECATGLALLSALFVSLGAWIAARVR